MKKVVLVTLSVCIMIIVITLCLISIIAYAKYVNEQTRTNSLYISKDSCSTYGDNLNYALICADMMSESPDMDYFKLV